MIGLQGTPRIPRTGILKLVGLQKIPSEAPISVGGFVASFEIVAKLDFGTAAIRPAGLWSMNQ